VQSGILMLQLRCGIVAQSPFSATERSRPAPEDRP
jgi:hypothetical protein